MGLVATTAVAFAVGAYLSQDAAGGWAILWLLASLMALLGMNAAVQHSAPLALGLLHVFGLFLGFASGSAVGYYIQTDPQVVWEAGAATALFMTAFGIAGYATRRDLSWLTRWLLWALVGLIAFGVVLIFVQVPGGSLVYAGAGLVIFAGLTLLDFQRLRRIDDVRTAPLLAASIFLDVLNVFQLFLSILGNDE